MGIPRFAAVAFFPITLALLGLVLGSGSCAGGDQRVVARQIRARSDLIGGPGALGEVGDWLLANQRIRVIIQGEGFSRGFGVYGGSLIDADLERVRRRSLGDSRGGLGRDNFSEMFPALFLKAMRPTRIEAVDNGDGSRSIVVSGGPGDFLQLASTVNDLIAPTDNLRFTNEYRLAPGARWVEIITTLRNVGPSPVELPDPSVIDLLGDGVELELPVGDVLLFGAGNDLFAEGAGFDLRFTLEAALRAPPGLPRLPGLVVPFLASRGEGVSYGLLSGVTDPTLSFIERAGYRTGAAEDGPLPDPRDLVVPFLASAFTGVFYGAAPRVLLGRGNERVACDGPEACGGGLCSGGRCTCQPSTAEARCPEGSWCVDGICDRSAFSFSKFFIVGDGDVASVRDAVFELRGDAAGQVAGLVREGLTQAPEVGVDVVTFDAAGRAYNQHTTDSTGAFAGRYAPGRYTYQVVADGRSPTEPRAFEVAAGARTFIEVDLPSPGAVSVRLRATDGRALPGRCSLVGVHAATATSVEGRQFLYDLRLGERIRPRDLEPDDAARPDTRRFVEEVIFAGTEPRTERVRPGTYTAHCSRGLEYEVLTRSIEVHPGRVTPIDVVLRRAIDTAGWASGDFHLHSVHSVDSSMSLERRVAHVAAEGVDLACSSDHNFITDYTQAIAAQGLETWVQGMVGLEMTTLELGHFNGFPLRYDPGPITKGAFEWSGRPPQEIFDDLRALGKHGPDRTIIQVNHPRDALQGYFNAYNLNPELGTAEEGDDLFFTPAGPEFEPERFSEGFDALEIVNGKRRDLLLTYRVPSELPPPPLPEVVPPAGEVLRDAEGRVAFPGAREDWFTALNLGRLYTATGNSDTHGPEDEPGVPRTFFPVTDDRPGAIDELEVVDALQNQRALVTNGPFVRVSLTGDGPCRRLVRRREPPECAGRPDICGAPLGRVRCELGELTPARPDGSVRLELSVEAADWVDVDRLQVIRNGEPHLTLEGRGNILRASTIDLSLEGSGDAWLVVEVTGSRSMFPVVTPIEIEPIQVADAVDAIGSGFGFDLSPFGNLRPRVVTPALPYAITNPIFVDANRDGRFTPPGLSSARARASSLRTSVRSPPADVPVLLRMFSLFSGHAH